MTTPQQVETVKGIIRIKNKILQSNDWDEIADLIQSAIDLSANVPAHKDLDVLDRTKSKEWNVLALKTLIKAVREKDFINYDAAYPQVAASLLRLSMVFVKGGFYAHVGEDVNALVALKY